MTLKNMKKLWLLCLLTAAFQYVGAQQIESIHLNLYTDSLKKGTHNYINVDGKLSDGSWLPLTDKQIKFTSDYGKFEGNNLVLPDEPTVKKVIISVALKTNAKKTQQVTLWIKQKPDPPLAKDDVDGRRARPNKR